MQKLQYSNTLGTWAVVLVVAATACIGCSKSGGPVADSQPASPARPELTNVYQVAPTINLLNELKLQRDVVRGDFRWEDESLTFSGQQAQANVPIEFPEQYELLITVARIKGNESLNLGFQFGGVTTSVVIEGWGERVSAINLVDGKLGLNNETRSEFPVFKDTEPKNIRIVVRRESILVDVDGGVFIDYRDSPSRLSFDERYFRRPGMNQLMIASWNSTFQVSSCVLKPFGDQPVQYAETRPEDASTADMSVIVSQAEPSSNRSSEQNVPVVNDSVPPDARDEPVGASPELASELSPKNDPSEKAVETETGAEALPRGLPWKAEPDPSRWALANLSEHHIRVQMDSGTALIPLGRSPFFCTMKDQDDLVQCQLHDLSKGEVVGKALTLSNSSRGISQLADSGQALLTYVRTGGSIQLEVHSFVTGERIFTLESPDDRIRNHRRDWLLAGQKLLSLRSIDNRLQVTLRDLQTEEVISTWEYMPDQRDFATFSVTPGGRFALAASNQMLYVHEVISGQLVGQVPIPESVDELIGMAFNSDATELAIVASYDKKPSSQLWCLDWRTGETVFLADTGFKLDSLHNVYKFGPAMEWVPGDQLLLFYGRDLIDRQTGRFFYRIPENVFWQMPRRTLSPTMLLAMMPSEDPNVREYRSIPLDRSTMSDALQVIRRGGLATDIGLPPLTIPMPNSGRTIPEISTKAEVSIRPEPRAALQDNAVKLPQKLTRLKEIRSEIKRIQMADSSAAVAVAHLYLKGQRESDSQHLIVRYDLRRGVSTGSLPIRSDYQLIDVSPDGSRALVGMANNVHTFSRLDVIDLSQKSHVAGWRPYSDQPFRPNVDLRGQPAAIDPQTASWVRFLDNDHVLTVNPGGRLVVWNLPACEATLTVDHYGKPFDLSADRRYLVGSDGSALSLLDLREGDWAGELLAEESPQSVLRAAFDPSGAELAAVLAYQGRRVLMFWNLTNGRVVEQFDLIYSSVSPGWLAYSQPFHRRIGLEYKREGYLLLDDLYLIDRRARTIPWSYGLRLGRHMAGELDDREWFVQQIGGSGTKGQHWDWILAALPVPSDEVITQAANFDTSSGELPTKRSVLTVDGEQTAID